MAGKTEGMVALAGIEHDGAEVDLSATTTRDTDDLIITENADLGTYEAVLGGETVAGVVYSKAATTSRCWRHPCSLRSRARGSQPGSSAASLTRFGRKEKPHRREEHHDDC
jgi:hypothetical protein